MKLPIHTTFLIHQLFCSATRKICSVKKSKTIPLTICLMILEDQLVILTQQSILLEQKFLSLNKEERQVYSHVTCATDTRNIKNVFDNVKEIIIKML